MKRIFNGMDYDVWNPQTDRNLARPFDAEDLTARMENKRALQQRLGLPQREDVPLIGMVTRLDSQKGLEIVGHAIHLLMNNAAGEAQFVVVGTGDSRYEDMFRQLAGYHGNKMRAILAYAGDLAPLVYGGSDIFLMPSLFEPCGLGQMIAMRYGSIPLVRAVGGLHDTVTDSETGFVFVDKKVKSFNDTLRRALQCYPDRSRWLNLQKVGMAQDFSWSNSAQKYLDLYKKLINEATAPLRTANGIKLHEG